MKITLNELKQLIRKIILYESKNEITPMTPEQENAYKDIIRIFEHGYSKENEQQAKSLAEILGVKKNVNIYIKAHKTYLNRKRLLTDKQLKMLVDNNIFKDKTILDLSKCKELTDISPIASLENLKLLNLRECEKVTDISPIVSLKNLKYFYFSKQHQDQANLLQKYLPNCAMALGKK